MSHAMPSGFGLASPFQALLYALEQPGYVGGIPRHLAAAGDHLAAEAVRRCRWTDLYILLVMALAGVRPLLPLDRAGPTALHPQRMPARFVGVVFGWVGHPN